VGRWCLLSRSVYSKHTGICVSGQVIDSTQTYQYPIKELRDEGSGEALAEAIEGLGLGSVPGITIYKRQVVWGDGQGIFAGEDCRLTWLDSSWDTTLRVLENTRKCAAQPTNRKAKSIDAVR
jgi:hypothetical protein